VTEGATDDVISLLESAPKENVNEEFTDATNFKFSMFNQNVSEFKEDKVCSPLAIAVNVGDMKIVDALLNYMRGFNIEFGLEVSNQTKAVKSNAYTTLKKTTPLQFACSLGLYTIVGRLLKERANPNLLNNWAEKDK
jgi:hypothetical protein